ncbi:MAG: winged helix-turn-helix domain-containing protein [Candidatus Sifarchaeia archaeon]
MNHGPDQDNSPRGIVLLDKDDVLDATFNALSHTIRRQIITMIGNQGAVSYTDLTELDLEPGTLYFHLDSLAKSEDPLLKRTGNKLYALTELGQAAYEIIQQGEDQVGPVVKAAGSPGTTQALIIDSVSLKPIVVRIQSDPWRFFFEIVVFLGLYGYFASEVGLLPVFLFFLQGSYDVGLAILAALGAWIATYLLVEALSVPILGKRGLSKGLLASVPMAFVPHILVETMLYFIPPIEILSGWPLTILLTIIIGWSTLILTVAVAKAKTVRYSRAAIVTLIVMNLNLLVLALVSSTLIP